MRKKLEKLLLAGALMTGISDSSLVNPAQADMLYVNIPSVLEYSNINYSTNKIGGITFIYPKNMTINWHNPIGNTPEEIKGYILYHSTDETNYTDATFVAGTAYNYTFPAQADTHFFVTRPVYNDDSLGGFSLVADLTALSTNFTISPGTNYVDVIFETIGNLDPKFLREFLFQFRVFNSKRDSYMTQTDLETTDIGNGRIRKKTRLLTDEIFPGETNLTVRYDYVSPYSHIFRPIRTVPDSAVMASPDEIRPSAPSLFHKVK